MPTISKELSHIYGRDVRPLEMTAEDCNNARDLAMLGIEISPAFVRQAMDALVHEGFGMDDLQGLTTSPSITTPVQFLQAWLPGFVRVITAARKIDELIGITTAGSWEDEEVVQGVLELTGEAELYGDLTNIPLASWNTSFERRTVLRFEQGFMVGMLEEMRTARMKVNTAAEKRSAAAMALDIRRNRIGFLGFNGGNNRTYGFLNDPSLPAYVTAPATGAGSATTWASKSFLALTGDIRGMMARLQAATQETIDVSKVPLVLAVASNVAQYLTVVSDFGISFRNWLTSNYSNIRLIAVPELNGANGGANVAYLYPERIDDGSSDDGKVWAQIVPAKFKVLGVEKRAKGYVEDFSNATAGVFLKRPFAVQRLTGI